MGLGAHQRGKQLLAGKEGRCGLCGAFITGALLQFEYPSIAKRLALVNLAQDHDHEERESPARSFFGLGVITVVCSTRNCEQDHIWEVVITELYIVINAKCGTCFSPRRMPPAAHLIVS